MADEQVNTVEVDLLQGMCFRAAGEDGIAVELDAPLEHGGCGGGLRPLELLLIGLGGCTGMDVISILRKKRQDVTGYRIEVDGTRANQHPKVFTEIRGRHIVRGNNVSEEAVRRAIELSETKYCPAFAMLEKAAPISSTFEVHSDVPAD
jgi:putative redox protein